MKFKNVADSFDVKQIRYRADTLLVLSGISCIFKGGHKVGIVGCTGSGKSTLIGALFRLVEPAGGKIIVDGIDISTIRLHDLRSRFGIIPQDSFQWDCEIQLGSLISALRPGNMGGTARSMMHSFLVDYFGMVANLD